MRTSVHPRYNFGLAGMARRAFAITFLSIVCVWSIVAPLSTRAQAVRGINSDGTDFFMGMMPGIPHPAGFSHESEADYFLIGSYEDNNVVTINYFTGGGAEVTGKTLILSKGMCQQVTVDRASMFPTRPGEVLEFKSAHIHSRYPISVQFYAEGSSAGQLYQGIETPALGKSYVVAAWIDNPLRNNPGSINRDSSSSEFMIIAAYDNTNVTFTPNSTTFAGAIGVNTGAGSNGTTHPVTITMRRGQTYWVRSNPLDISDDLSGSTIVSDKPVVVLGGQERAMIGDPSAFWTALDNDIRNTVAEEMTPVSSWGSDYPAIPTMPASIEDVTIAGDGDLYRLYTNDPAGVSMDMWKDFPSAEYGPQGVSLYEAPAADYENITEPVDLLVNSHSKDASGNLKKMYAVQYQYFQGHHDWNPNRKAGSGKGVSTQSGGGDSPQDETSYRCEEEMNLVPIDHWRMSTVFMVPKNTDYAGYQFISIITNKDSIQKIFIIRNNASTGSLLSYTPKRTYQIPNHPEIVGLTIQLTPASYVITGNTPFACYSYGRTETLYKDIFGYSAPTGQAYGSYDQPNPPKADITPTCGDWDIRLHETGTVGDVGIANVMLLDDPNGFFARPPRVSFNCRLVGSGNDPNDPTSPPFVAGDTSLEFHVQVADPSKNAYAAIYVVDPAGNDTVIELYYTAPQIALSKNVVAFPDTVILTNECENFTLHLGSTGSYSSIDLPPAVLRGLDTSGDFRITSNPTLPAALKAGDSVVFTVCFSSSDTNLHKDSIQFIAGCLDTALLVEGRGLTPIIIASDQDFGNVTVGDTVCRDITVQNVGGYNLILDSNWVLHLNPDYTFGGPIPDTIAPGGAKTQKTLRFCFHPSGKGPSDSRMDWGTNLLGQYEHDKKDTSQLLGYGIAPGMNWDPHDQPFTVECQDSEIIRVHLTNPSTGTEGADLTVDELKVVGPDASDFTIIDNQTGNASFQLLKDDSVWVDLRFNPDLSKGYVVRQAKIVANGHDNASKFYTDSLACSGFIRHAIVAVNPASYNFGDQSPNTLLTQTFTITNSGDTGFVYTGLNLNGADFTILSGPAIGSTLLPGATDTIVIQYKAKPSGGVSTGALALVGDHPLCSSAAATFSGTSEDVAVSETPVNYPITYICHNDTASISATNIGTEGVLLDSVQIIDSAGMVPASSQFAFYATETQIYKTMLGLDSGQTVAFPVRYTPSLSDSVVAVAVFYWEDTSRGQTRYFQDRKPISGIGYQAANLVTLLNPTASTGAYSAITANDVSMPVQLKKPFDPIAQVYGVEFTLRYYRDVFQYRSPVVPQPGLTVVNNPQPVVDPSDNKYELLTIQLGSTTPIVDSGVMATVNWQYVVAKDSTSPFDIKDVMFLDQTGAQACWVDTATTPATFYGLNTCGDATLREYLKGGMPAFSIGQIVPNPMNGSASVDFTVIEDGVPVTMQVYNALGEPVQTVIKDAPHAKGAYRVQIDASELPSGLYTIFITTPGFGVSKQVLVTK